MNIKTSLAVALVVGTVAVAHAAGPQGPPTAPSQSPAASPQTSPTRGAAPATGSVTNTQRPPLRPVQEDADTVAEILVAQEGQLFAAQVQRRQFRRRDQVYPLRFVQDFHRVLLHHS